LIAVRVGQRQYIAWQLRMKGASCGDRVAPHCFVPGVAGGAASGRVALLCCVCLASSIGLLWAAAVHAVHDCVCQQQKGAEAALVSPGQNAGRVFRTGSRSLVALGMCGCGRSMQECGCKVVWLHAGGMLPGECVCVLGVLF
jgi:hypothetical protein